MVSVQMNRFDQINTLQARLTNAWVHYWQHYSSLDSWHFWCLIVLLFLPLIVLYLFIDRTRALQIGFFGFNVHVWTTKLDAVAVNNGLWNYPYTLVPYLPSSPVLDASLTPIMFMLLYQWTLKRDKNFYLYAVGLSFVLAFFMRPAFATFAFFKVTHLAYYVVLFFIHLTIAVVSKWTTSVFLHFQMEGNVLARNTEPDVPLSDKISSRVPIYNKHRRSRRAPRP